MQASSFRQGTELCLYIRRNNKEIMRFLCIDSVIQEKQIICGPILHISRDDDFIRFGGKYFGFECFLNCFETEKIITQKLKMKRKPVTN